MQVDFFTYNIAWWIISPPFQANNVNGSDTCSIIYWYILSAR